MIVTLIVISIATVMWMEYGVVCNKSVLDHLHKYSNLFDDSFDGEYTILDIGLPFGVTPMSLDECVDFIIEERPVRELEK